MSWSTPVNVIANVLDNIQEDPQAQRLMLGIGPAVDVMRNAPINLFSSLPHFESEVDDRVPANSGSAPS